MRMKRILLSGAAGAALGLSLAGASLANPNEAPDLVAEISEHLGLGNSQIDDLELRDESLNRDGLTANYYAGFSLSAPAPSSTYAEVDSGQGYVVVQQVIAEGDPVPVSGNVLGAYENGAWEVQVNLTEVRNPGGKPFARFASADRVVMMAGSADLEAFIEARKEAQALAHELALQEIEEEAVEAKLRAEREAEQAKIDAITEAEQAKLKMKADAEVAEARRTHAAREEAQIVAEREAADAMIQALFEDGATVSGQLAYNGERVGGTMEIQRISDEVVELASSFPRGNKGIYKTTAVLKLSHEPGVMHISLPKVNSWNGSRKSCAALARPNVEGGFVRFVSNEFGCKFEFLVEGLKADEASSETES